MGCFQQSTMSCTVMDDLHGEAVVAEPAETPPWGRVGDRHPLCQLPVPCAPMPSHHATYLELFQHRGGQVEHCLRVSDPSPPQIDMIATMVKIHEIVYHIFF